MADVFTLKDLSGTTLFNVDSNGDATLTGDISLVDLTLTGNTIVGNASTDTVAINADLTTGLKWDAGTYTYLLDASAMTTGQADIVVGDNLASALAVREASTDYFVVVTTNSAERVNVAKPLTLGAALQTIDMADAEVELVWGIAAGAGQVLVTSNLLAIDPNSGGASENLRIDSTLPAGLVLFIQNTGGEAIALISNDGGALGTIDTGKAAAAVCNGSGGALLIVGG